jgi:predicted DNA-binding antitoxin AbrB/MazE fold protein
MPPVEVIYENGVLRPLRPLDLAEGTRLEVTLVKITAPGSEQAHVDEADYAAFLNELDKIAGLPLESQPQPDAASNHDAILYPKQGRIR